MAARQPIVREAIIAFATEHLSENVGSATVAGVRKRRVVQPVSTTKAIESAIAVLQGRFSYIEVLQRLDEQGLPLNVRNRRTAVGAVLRKLRKRKIIQELQKGIGGNPSYYERLANWQFDQLGRFGHFDPRAVVATSPLKMSV